jgi:exodeoxyribonuclease VII large subunit
LSPLATLQRGYSIVQKSDGAFVKHSAQVEPGDPVKITLASGKINCEVLSKES